MSEFVQADDIPLKAGDLQTLEKYGYAQNNPVRYNDPSGHCIFGIDTAVCIAVAVAVITYVAENPEIIDGIDAEAAQVADEAPALIDEAQPALDRVVGEGEKFVQDASNELQNSGAGTGSNAGTIVRMTDPYDETVQLGANNVSENPVVDGAYHVVGHGSPDDIEGVDGASLNANDLADMIKRDPEYKSGTPVCLVSCSTGANADGFAQQLANILQTRVYAASDDVSAITLKVMFGGDWSWFEPK